MLEIIFNGEVDPNDSNQVLYTGAVEPYGTITLTFNRITGAWSAALPEGFPSGIDITAVWEDIDPSVIRPEPTTEDQISLATPESAIAGTSYGTFRGDNHFDFLEDVPWSRPLTTEGERRLLEGLKLDGDAKMSVVLRKPTVLDQGNVPWVVEAITSQIGLDPIQSSLAESRTYHDTSFALTPEGLSNVGLVYGVLVADPQAFFGPKFKDGLWEWWPFNEHPESELVIEEKLWKTSVSLSRPFMAQDRMFIEGWGWKLLLPKESSVTLPFHQPFPEGGFTLSFRLRPVVVTGPTGEVTFLTLGPLEFVLTSNGTTLQIVNDGVIFVAEPLTIGVDYYIAITGDGSGPITRGIIFNEEDSSYSNYYGGPNLIVEGSAEIALSGGDVTALIGDLRVWNKEKTLDELIALQAPVFRTAPQARWPSTVVAPDGSIRAMLAHGKSGHVYLGMPPHQWSGGRWVPVNSQFVLEAQNTELLQTEATVADDPRREDLGLEGGRVPGEPWTLGSQFHPVMADGHVVVSNTLGIIGSNAPWEDEWTLQPAGSRNVAFHRIFASSDHPLSATSKKTWQLTVSGSISGGVSFPVLNVTEVERGSQTMPLIDGEGYYLTIDPVTGSLSRAGASGLFPTVYLYGPSSVNVDLQGTSAWVDQNDFGLGLGFPALDGRGKLTFYVAEALEPGPYRLTLDAGNFGQVENGFEGLYVDVNVGQTTSFPMLINGPERLNPRGEITRDFELETAVNPGWLLEVSWEGKLDYPQQHISYALAVYGVKLERMLPTLYRLDSPTLLTPVSPSSHVSHTQISGTTPGGWVGVLGSIGNFTDWVHESEEATRELPLGHLASVTSESKTGTTIKRTDDILLESSDWATADPAAPAVPVISAFSTPHYALMGDTITYTATGVTDATALVWEFWDGEVRVTAPTTLTQSKKLTKGGVVTSSLTAVNAVGDSTKLTDTFTADWAPDILGLDISQNDAVAPYDTTVKVWARDTDSGSGTYPSSRVYGTLAGVVDYISTTIGGVVEGTLTLPLTITGDEDHILTVSDILGADRAIPMSFRSRASRPIIVTVTPIPRKVRIGEGATVKLTALAIDLDGEAIETFSWSLLKANGWSDNFTLSGTSQALNGGAWQNTVVVDVSGEPEGDAIAIVNVTTTSGKTGQGSATVVFDVNNPPVLRYFSVVPGTIQAGNEVQFGADAYDPENDAITYDWSFDAPSISLSGNPVIVTPVYGTIPGTLTMTDVLGAQTVAVIPKMMVTSAMVVRGTVGTPFTYVPTAMGVPYPSFTVDQVPPGMAYVNGTVTGIPGSVGLGTISLTATSIDGTDSRHVFVNIVQGKEPGAPTNLLVKGMVYPTYHTGEDISMTWDSNGDNYTILKFYRLDDSLALQVTIDPGVESYAIDNIHLVQALGSEQSFIIHAHSSNGVVESATFIEAGVHFLG